MKWFPHKNEYQLQQFNFVKLLVVSFTVGKKVIFRTMVGFEPGTSKF